MEDKKLNILSFTLSLGLLGFLVILYISIHFSITQFGKEFLALFESIHPGFELTKNVGKETFPLWKNILGIIINSLWALGDGLILGFIFSYTYNLITDKQTKSTKTKKEQEKEEE